MKQRRNNNNKKKVNNLLIAQKYNKELKNCISVKAKRAKKILWCELLLMKNLPKTRDDDDKVKRKERNIKLWIVCLKEDNIIKVN